jgi:hypothetical protein
MRWAMAAAMAMAKGRRGEEERSNMQYGAAPMECEDLNKRSLNESCLSGRHSQVHVRMLLYLRVLLPLACTLLFSAEIQCAYLSSPRSSVFFFLLGQSASALCFRGGKRSKAFQWLLHWMLTAVSRR